MEATREACVRAQREKVEVLLLQEPYMRLGKMQGMEGRWFYCTEDGEAWAAVVITNEDVVGVLKRERSNKYVVCVSLRWMGKKMRVVSAYCRPSLPIGDMLNKAQQILVEARSRRVVVGMDANAGSPLWGEAVVDERGSEVEELILAHDLTVLNKTGQLTTFEGYIGRGRNVDVSMVTEDLGREKWEWKVIDREFSDHREIEMVWTGEARGGRRGNDMAQGQWNWREADWYEMNKMVRKAVDETEWEGMGVNQMAERVQEIVLVACENCVEKVVKKVRQVRWWSRELSDMRLEVKRKRRTWIRYRVERDRQNLRGYIAEYKKRIKERKREVWESGTG